MKKLHPSQFTVGLTTFNRKETLLNSLKSIKRLHQDHDYLILDDCSNEYDVSFLVENFQNWRVFRSGTNSGRADFAISNLMNLFLESGREYLILLDSDLIVDEDLSDFVCEYTNETDGIYSLFNTPSHESFELRGRWVLKNTVGSAATVWKREVLQDIKQNVPVSRQFDWDWSKYIRDKGLNIFVSERSYVQHLGFSNGQNSNNFLMGDLGLNFKKYNN